MPFLSVLNFLLNDMLQNTYGATIIKIVEGMKTN